MYIALPLSHIINLSILTGIVQNYLKIAKVVPIYQIKGNNADQKKVATKGPILKRSNLQKI